MIELIKSLGPSLITVSLTAVFASYFIPRWQERSINRKLVAEKRLKAIETTADSFVRYVLAWRRLIQYAEAIGPGKPTEEQAEKRLAFALERNGHKENLFAALHQSVAYFDRDTFRLFEEFIEWDEAQSIKTLDELPDIAAWWEWQSRIITRMKRGLDGFPGFAEDPEGR